MTLDEFRRECMLDIVNPKCGENEIICRTDMAFQAKAILRPDGNGGFLVCEVILPYCTNALHRALQDLTHFGVRVTTSESFR